MTFLDLHVLQTVPPSNINRDDSGSPKTALYGNVQRARVSSQAWKRAVRLAFEADPETSREAGRRTKKIPQVIGDALAARCPDLASNADLIGLKAAAAMFKIKAAAPKKPKKDKDGNEKESEPVKRLTTEYLLFFGDDQLDRVADTLTEAHAALGAAGSDEAKIEMAVATLGLDRLGVIGHPGAVALFGRMIADSPDTNVDAACQVAHALSTHAVTPEFDYYTAVDDNPDPASKGAAMVGVVEFNSATLYRFASVSMRDLVRNLDGDVDHALSVAMSFAKAFITAMPSGKRSTFANSTRPDFVMLAIRDDQPVSLVGAFERPVRTESGLMAKSCAQLLRYRGEQDTLYGTAPVQEAVVYPSYLADDMRDRDFKDLPESETLPAALTRTRDALERLAKK